MAQLVGGFIVPHAPFACARPDAPPKPQADAVFAAFAHVRDRIRALDVDTVVVIGSDHYTIHGPNCIPSVLIGIGDLTGPVEPWLGLPRARIANNDGLARHIAVHGHRNGVDWAYAKTMVLDHATYVPWHHAVREVEGVRMIPVYLNAGVDPIIPTRRAHQVGQAIAAALAADTSDSRVAIYGTGGLSHWPGMARMGQINTEFDARMIELITSGGVERLINFADGEILEDGGNGGLELKNWVCAMGAFGACTGEMIAYEPVYEWSCGCAFAELKRAA